MANKAILDTSFLIALVDSNDRLHTNTKIYYEWFIKEGFELFVSSIALSEYCVKNDISHLTVRPPAPLPSELPHKIFNYLFFNYRDAIVAGSLFSEHSDRAENKDCLKDDFKIIAQALNNKVDRFATADSKLVRRMEGFNLGFNFIDINNSPSDYTGEFNFDS